MHVLQPGITNPYARLQPSVKRPANMTSDAFFDPTQNRMVGFGRMRQLRVRNDSCQLFPAYKRFRDECFGVYSAVNEDVEPFGAGAIKYVYLKAFPPRSATLTWWWGFAPMTRKISTIWRIGAY